MVTMAPVARVGKVETLTFSSRWAVHGEPVAGPA
jgi:hypothetical protein